MQSISCFRDVLHNDSVDYSLLDSGGFVHLENPSQRRFLHCFRALESTSSHAEGGDAYSHRQAIEWIKIRSTRAIQNPASPSVSLSPGCISANSPTEGHWEDQTERQAAWQDNRSASARKPMSKTAYSAVRRDQLDAPLPSLNYLWNRRCQDHVFRLLKAVHKSNNLSFILANL